MDLVKRLHGRPATPSPLGTTIFIGLRLLDPLLQYSLLTRHVGIAFIPKLLGGTLLPRPPTDPSAFLGLAPYELVLLGMSTGSSLKQIFWLLFTSREEMSPSNATIISLFNTISNSINTILALWSYTALYKSIDDLTTTSSILDHPVVFLGIALYTAGMFTEIVLEIQRSRFKSDPRNEGKPYSGGLFGLARNINYGGFSAWRTGYTLTAAGPFWGTMEAVLLFYDFSTRSIPVLDKYCQQRYGDAWTAVKAKVPYTLIPGVY